MRSKNEATAVGLDRALGFADAALKALEAIDPHALDGRPFSLFEARIALPGTIEAVKYLVRKLETARAHVAAGETRKEGGRR